MHIIITKLTQLKKPRYLLLLAVAVAIWLLITILQAQWNNYKHHQYQQLLATAVIQPVKVFQIGFSKCGTVTLANFFASNGVSSVHHDGGQLPISIHKNYKKGLPLIAPKYHRSYVFTDMEVLYQEPQISVGMQYLKELDQQYPGSKFILNTRNKQAWLKSRSLQPILPENTPLLKVSADILKISEAEMLQRWSQEWDAHHRNVLEYFKNRPNDLLVFNIEQDPPENLVAFFKDYFRLDVKHYEKKNQTAYRKLTALWHKLFPGDKPVVFLEGSTPLKRAASTTQGSS